MTEPKTPEQLRTREIVNRMFSVVFAAMFAGTIAIVWAAAMYRFAMWAF